MPQDMSGSRPPESDPEELRRLLDAELLGRFLDHRLSMTQHRWAFPRVVTYRVGLTKQDLKTSAFPVLDADTLCIPVIHDPVAWGELWRRGLTQNPKHTGMKGLVP